MHSNIFLTGFSGTGKSAVGRLAARTLGWRFVDTDEEVVKKAGRPIVDIFSKEGEGYFRRLESQALKVVCKEENQVVSTGGGIVIDEKNREMMKSHGVVICLDATPETIHDRLVKQGESSGNGTDVRPLLAGANPLGKIRSLKAQRDAYYGDANWTVHTDLLTEGEASAEVVRSYQAVASRLIEAQGKQADVAAVVRTSTESYPIFVGYDILESVGQRVKEIVKAGVAYVVSDEGVHRHARRVQVLLEASGVAAHTFIIPSGEQSKSLETAQRIYGWLTSLKAERKHLIVAVGGGVVGDLAGFVAATFLRGVPLVQVPTSLAAMVDASIGGKTAVNLPQGKNLVGAFYQPKFVLADIRTLETLPSRELRSGWAEAIKHGLILDRLLFEVFEKNAKSIGALDSELATGVIRRSMAIKAQVVSQDEKETLGLRVILNYGHTIGHGLEAATDYETLLHGEAVSIGMMGAARISQKMGMLSEDDVERQRLVLEAYGLPTSISGVDLDNVKGAMLLDKKVRGRAINWVLLDGIGKAVVRSDVPQDVVQEVLSSLTG